MIRTFTGRRILISVKNNFRQSLNRNIINTLKTGYLIQSKSLLPTITAQRLFSNSRRAPNEENKNKKKSKKLIIPHIESNEILKRSEITTGQKIKSQETLSNDENRKDKPKDFSKIDKFSLINSMTNINRTTKEILRDSNVPEWKKQKLALKRKFQNQGWSPLKKVSREDMESIKTLKKNMPLLNNTQIGEYFKISSEAVRRILKSNWKPKNLEEDEKVYERWKKRGERIKSMHQATSNISNVDNKNIPKFLSQEDKSRLYNSNDKTRMSNKKRRLLKKQKKLTDHSNSNQNKIGDWEF